MKFHSHPKCTIFTEPIWADRDVRGFTGRRSLIFGRVVSNAGHVTHRDGPTSFRAPTAPKISLVGFAQAHVVATSSTTAPIHSRGFIKASVLKTIFKFVLGPLPRGVPGEGPDCHCPKKIGGFWADSGPDTGGTILSILILALSAARSSYTKSRIYSKCPSTILRNCPNRVETLSRPIPGPNRPIATISGSLDVV